MTLQPLTQEIGYNMDVSSPARDARTTVLYHGFADAHSLAYRGATMNYQAHYNRLIERARLRPLPDGHIERHHVIPRCMGGNDDQVNLVNLTPEEHYVAHQLLVKIYPDNSKLIVSAMIMTTGGSRTNKLYGWIRRKISTSQTGKTLSLDHRKKISDGCPWKGGKRPEHSEKMKQNNPMSNPVHKAAQLKVTGSDWFREFQRKQSSGENNPMFGKPCTWQSQGKPHPMLGKKHSEESKLKARNTMLMYIENKKKENQNGD